uniref:Uncharacterized protein n=1 Tax=Rhizophora mucronata TaxID=61149 RepID=A0A2P2KK97_RHIMU
MHLFCLFVEVYTLLCVGRFLGQTTGEGRE